MAQGEGSRKATPASPMIFNIVVDTVVRAVLSVFCGPQDAKHGMGCVERELNLVFYMY